MRRRSITFRLALYFAVASTVVLLAIGYLVTHSVDRHFVELDGNELYGKLALIRHVLAKTRTPVDLAALPERMDDALTGHDMLSVAISKPDGGTLFRTKNAMIPDPLPTVPLPTAPGQDATNPQLASWSANGHVYRGFAIREPIEDGDLGHVLVFIALNTDDHHRFLMVFYRTLWLAIGAGIIAIVLLGWLAAKRGLTPLREMTEVARSVTATRLGDRLPLDTLPVELLDLGKAFNGMLARLEDSFRRLSEFSSDLAHELRTPIANLTTQTQVALSRARTPEEYREVLYSNTEEFDRLARTISDMLFLAKADNGLIVPRSETIDLRNEVGELFEFYDALAEERGIRLAVSGEAIARGERLMIRRAIGNLLSNALNHTPRGGVVDVRLEQPRGGDARVSVENRGDGIAAEHLSRIFDRFYRIDPSRQRQTDGAGLGLAITKSIVTAHHGTVRATSSDGLTKFEISLPESAAA
jgi:two-component system heavy metal sensor histidine kinase CusS